MSATSYGATPKNQIEKKERTILMKNFFKIIVSMGMLVTLLVCFSTSAFAATSGSTNTATINVTTKANWALPGSESITLKQTAGTYNWRNAVTGKTGTATGYGYYDVKAVPTSGAGTKTITTTFSSASKTINLEANTTYKITVSYNIAGQNNITFMRSRPRPQNQSR